MHKIVHDKLFNYEAQPSLNLWDKIACSLDSDSEHSLAEKMSQYEAIPPGTTWNNIMAELNRDNKSVPFGRKYVVLKYVSAAAFLIGCVVLMVLFSSRKQDDNEVSITNQKGNLLKSSDRKNALVSTNNNERNNLEDETITGSIISSLHARKSSSARLYSLPPRHHSASIRNKLSTKSLTKKPLVSSELLDRYIVFSKATGEAVKLSKKLFGLFACSEKDISCKQNIASVQQKMASSTMMASADFTAVLEALQTMNKE